MRDTALTDFDALPRRQNDVDDAYLCELIQHAARFVSQSRLTAELPEGLPQDVPQEADENVGEHAVLFLVPDRPDTQISFVNLERGFRLRQLHVRFPKFFVSPVQNIGSQQIATGTQRGPVANVFDLLPLQQRAAVFTLLDLDFKESRGTSVLSQHPTDFPFDFLNIAALILATCRHGS